LAAPVVSDAILNPNGQQGIRCQPFAARTVKGAARSADRFPELDALLHRLRDLGHVDDRVDLVIRDEAEIAGAVAEVHRIIGFHYGEPSTAVEPADE
jgi:hypothetical protein